MFQKTFGPKCYKCGKPADFYQAEFNPLLSEAPEIVYVCGEHK